MSASGTRPSVRRQSKIAPANEWHDLLTRHYGRTFTKSAERRARQAINAVLRHVPREMLEDLKGATDEERLAELEKRVPAVYARLQAAFRRAGLSPFAAKRVLTRTLERRGWEAEARALVIGSVIRFRGLGTRELGIKDLITASESLAGGKHVEARHVAAVIELRAPNEKPASFPEETKRLGEAAEKELADLSALLARAQDGEAEGAEVLAKALASIAIHKLNLITQAFPGLQDRVAQEARESLPKVAALAPKREPTRDGAETVAYVAGEGGKPKALATRYRAKGLVAVEMSAISDAYRYGQHVAAGEKPGVSTMSYDSFIEYLSKNPLPLGPIEQRAVQMAQHQAAQFVVGLGNRVDAATGQLLIEADAGLRARLRTEIKTATAENLARRESVKKLVGVPVNLIRWGRVVQMALDNQKAEALAEAVPPPADEAPDVSEEHTEAAQEQGGQLGFIFRESTAEPKPTEPVSGEQEQAGAGDGGLAEEALTPDSPTKPKGEPASTDAKLRRERDLIVPTKRKARGLGRGKPLKRRQHVEVGDHVYGSRADLAVPRTSGDLEKMTPSDQKRYVKKSKLLPPLDAQGHLDAGRTPGYVLMRDALEKCIQSAPADSQRARELYMDGVDFVTRSLDGCNTARDISDFVEEWHYLARGYELDQEFDVDELYKRRDAWLTRVREDKQAGVSSPTSRVYSTELPMTHAEWKAGKKALEQLDQKMAGLIEKYGGSAPGDAPDVKAVVDERQALRRKLRDYESVGGPIYNVWALVLTGSEHGATFETKPDGTVRVFERDHIAGGIKDNKYAQMAAALGKRMINVVGKHGPDHSGPKAYKDAARQVYQWRRKGTTAEEQEKQLFEVLGKKRKAGERKRRFVWQRQVTGEPIRKGGRPVASPDAERMARDFALKNVQFGNWVTDEDAAVHLEAAHGALFDLADVVGIDPGRVSLGGRLALAIGARGAGGPMAAAAHYELGREIINLTKLAGGGSLAHEWGHAMDNILAKHANPGSTRAGLYLSEGQAGKADPELATAYQRLMDTMTWADEETARKARRLDELHTRYRDAPRSLSYNEHAERRRLAREARDWKRSEFMEVSAGMTVSDNSYWTRPHEMFARCFEAYVQDQLEDNGRLNSYLVAGTRTPNPKLGRELHPYPMGEERKRINAAFDHLLSVMREGKHLEKALRALFGSTDPDLYVIPIG